MQNKERAKAKAKEIVLRFMRYNQGFVAIILSLVILSLSSSNRELSAIIQNKDSYIETLSNQVTYVSDAGVVKQYEIEKLDVFKEKQNVQNVLSKYLVVSAYELTDGYKRAFFPSPEELFKNTELFKEFFAEYITTNQSTATEERKEGYKSVMKDFEQIMAYFRNGINQNNIPHIIDKKESERETKVWQTKDETFTVRFLLPLYAKSRNNNDAVDEGATYAEIEAKGYFNLLEGSTVNPRGMKFTSLRLLHPEIDHSKRAQ